MNNTTVHRLYTPDSGCGDIRVRYENLALVLDYEFRATGNNQVGHLRFVDVVAFRFRDELHSSGFEKGSYDEIVELQKSEWLDQLRSIEPPGFGSLSGKRHFAVLLSNNGYLEVVARDVVAVASTLGLLGDGDAAAEH
jgi:hypothetical protein